MAGTTAIPLGGSIRSLCVKSYDDVGSQSDAGESRAVGVEFNRTIEALVADRRRNPENPATLIALAEAYFASGQLKDAIDSFTLALNANPNCALLQLNLGMAFLGVGRYAEAVVHFSRAIALHKEEGQAFLYRAHLQSGLAYIALHFFVEAREHFDAALQIDPFSVEALNGLGVAIMNSDQADSAVAARDVFLKTLSYDPQSPETLRNLGLVEYRLGNYRKALQRFDSALLCAPGMVAARVDRALIHLLLGHYAEGFSDYEFRCEAFFGSNYITEPRNPAEVAERPSSWKSVYWPGFRLHVVEEQGIGDQLFFLRFVPWLKSRGVIVTYSCHARMCKLLNGAPNFESILDRSGPPPIYDRAVSLGDLPLLSRFWESENQPPPPLPLRVNECQRAEAFATLQRLPRPWIGVTWRAGTENQGVKCLYKTIPVDSLRDALGKFQGTLVILQRNVMADEINAFRVGGLSVLDASKYGDDLEELAAMLDCLDDYIGVSNTNVHILAGLGKACHVFVPTPAEFRWMADGKQSPWFPLARVYRPDVDGWGMAFSLLASRIAQGFESGRLFGNIFPKI